MGDKIIFFIKYYLPVLVWAGLIFYFSSVSGLKVGADNLYAEVFWRKLAHIGEYVVLATLLFQLFYRGLNYEFRDSFLAVVALSGLYAASDEIHQLMVSERSGKIVDAAVDTLAAALTVELWGLVLLSEKRLKRLILAFCWALALVVPLVFIFKETQLTISQLELEKTLQEKNAATEKELEKNFSSADKNITESDEKNENNPENPKTVESLPKDIPEKFQIKVPFTSQAPFANWDDYHQEACEEASLVMLKYFLDGKSLTPEIADREILKLIDYQIEKYGDYRDTSAKSTVEIFENLYGTRTDGKKLAVVYDIKREDIKKYLAAGNPVIVMAAGRMLGNPNYTAPGPPYHVLVATGYDKNTIVTNDPGTRKGENYRYNIDVFYNAIHDFPGNLADMENGRKAIIVVK